MNPNDVGKLIREKRQNQNMTQKELASKLGVTDKAVSQWERGICFPDICTIESLSKELNISLIEIFTDSFDGMTQPINTNTEATIHNVLIYATDDLIKKKKKYKMAGIIILSMPLLLFILMAIILFILIKAIPLAPATETMGFLLLALWFYLIRIGLPLLFGYSLLLWRYSKYFNSAPFLYIKRWLSDVGILFSLLWLYESLKIILPNLIS